MTEMLKGVLEGIVLALLAGRPAYGYEITSWLRDQGFADIAEGTVYAVLVRVENVDRHCEHAKQHGAKIVRPPADYPFGERQYSVEDFAGRRWTFSQTIADVDPVTWGGTPGQL